MSSATPSPSTPPWAAALARHAQCRPPLCTRGCPCPAPPISAASRPGGPRELTTDAWPHRDHDDHASAAVRPRHALAVGCC
eukprot:scaffold1345_cov581-Prasinococcus_capsulatus_cf.AAC.7